MIRSMVTGVMLVPVSAAVAQAPPALRTGLWEFTRAVEGTGQPRNRMARKVCTSPTEDMNREITSKQILTTRGDSGYTVRIESNGTVGVQTVATRAKLVAKRLGDCP